MKQVAILGSTGSIGTNALQVIKNLNGEFNVVGLASRSNWKELARQIKEFKPNIAALIDEESYKQLRSEIDTKKTKLLCGQEAVEEIASYGKADLVLCAISGSTGLFSSIAALANAKTLALANKESLVIAGEFLMDLCRNTGGSIIPIDSEHSSIFQTMQSIDVTEIAKVTLTASGGPFLRRKNIRNVRISEALNHPIWKMGSRISIDSATLMNKALELVEACNLFNLKSSQIEVLIHPQSMIHSLVHLCDSSVIAHMSYPDMKIPIQYALTYPQRVKMNMTPPSINDLTFEKPDTKRFPGLLLGYEAARVGGTLPAAMNAADEIAVAAFLSSKIRFTDIYIVVEKVMSIHKVTTRPTLQTILDTDSWARRRANEYIKKIS